MCKFFNSNEEILHLGVCKLVKTSFKYKNFFHIGPPKDFDLFNGLKKNKSTEINKSE